MSDKNFLHIATEALLSYRERERSTIPVRWRQLGFFAPLPDELSFIVGEFPFVVEAFHNAIKNIT